MLALERMRQEERREDRRRDDQRYEAEKAEREDQRRKDLAAAEERHQQHQALMAMIFQQNGRT
jgi:hypothetical protein